MKKRILSLLLIAAMSFSLLAGCGSKDDDKTPETDKPEASTPVENQDPAFGADLTEFYNKIMAAAEEGPFMMDVAAEAEMLESVYPGLKDIETKQLVAFTPAMSAVATEFAFVEVANASDVDAVKTILQTRIDTQVNGGAWYPETIESWKNNSEIVVIDNYVCLFVCSEKDGMIDAFRNGTEVPVWAKAQAPAEDENGIGGMEDTTPSVDDVPAYDPDAEMPAEPSEAPAEPSTPAVEPSEAPAEPSTPAVEPETPAASIDLAAFYTDLYNSLYPLDAEGFSTGPYASDLMDYEAAGMTAEDAAMMLEMYYPGLAAVAAEQLHVYIPMMSFSAYEVVLMELTNASDMDAVKAMLQARIDAQAAGGAWYPEAVEGWVNNARIVTNGNYIMMAVGTDCDKFVDAFNAQF